LTEISSIRVLTANFGRKFFLSVKKCRKKQYKNITQITGDFIKKSEKYSKKVKNFTRQKKKIKLQTQNSATNLMELFIEQIDNEILRDKKKRKAAGYSVERRGDRRAAESQCYRHITNKREGHIFTKSSQTLGKRE